ncbi:hypothetical protein ACH40F_10050 [Streptomyces sp. NPDC020794]
MALLIAGGHSNRSAAAELEVSVNTVGTHLRDRPDALRHRA